MFHIGDVIIYSEHGLCEIEDICEKTIYDVTRTYYVMHPLGDTKLTISTPVDSDKVLMLELLNRDDAMEIIDSFKEPGAKWIEDIRQRNMKYHTVVKSGNRKDIAQIANTLMRKEREFGQNNKKLYDQDRKLLNTIQTILFTELATSLDTNVEEIRNRITSVIL
ncbi:CarD family transcriptional regulator [Neobacillus niacini]|uniref:CarD family transcriptional regulator n=1 Tax=Neobacillus niacini TaxID=86668 RepID=UPI0021CB5932|nr:CarD family transcriptional regulator [Neobacillus niacini]MCM3764947.1 CarD family transcriptional regulator [Neobacillus niacini]